MFWHGMCDLSKEQPTNALPYPQLTYLSCITPHHYFYIRSCQVWPTSILRVLRILEAKPRAIERIVYKNYRWIEELMSRNNMPVDGPDIQMMLKPLDPNHVVPKPAYSISTGLCQGLYFTKRRPICRLLAVQSYLFNVGAIFCWMPLKYSGGTTWYNRDLKGSLVWKPGDRPTKQTHQYGKLATAVNAFWGGFTSPKPRGLRRCSYVCCEGRLNISKLRRNLQYVNGNL